MTAIEKKKKATLNFFWFGSLFPIILPLVLLISYRFRFDKTLLENDVPYYFIILIVLGLLPFVAHYLYSCNHSFWKGKSEKYIPVDIFLYLVGILTITVVGFLVNMTGGHNSSILIFYFYFIPSAIAISFDAKISLWLIIPLSVFFVIYNYFSIPTQSIHFDVYSYRVLYALIIIIHFISIGVLEWLNNKLMKKAHEIQ